MSDESLKSKILTEYRAKGGCKDIYKSLCAASDKDDLADVYLAHPDWCMENDFPTLESLRENFNDLECKDIYIDCDFFGATIASQVAVFHNCRGNINVEMDYENEVIPMLYFANGCDMHVECRQENIPAIRVPLYIFGDSFVTTNGRGNATFKRHEHGIA